MQETRPLHAELRSCNWNLCLKMAYTNTMVYAADSLRAEGNTDQVKQLTEVLTLLPVYHFLSLFTLVVVVYSYT